MCLMTLKRWKAFQGIKFYMNICMYLFIHLLIHLFRSLFLTGPQPHQKRVLNEERTGAFYFSSQYLPFPSRFSSSCLRLLSCLSVTFILPSIFPSITRFRRQFPCNILPTQLTFLSIFYTILMPHSTLCNTSAFHTWSVQLISSNLLQHHNSNVPCMCDLLP